MKVYKFWNALCVEAGYRFFSGVSVVDLKVLHESMNPDFLHFVPALNESTALGLTSGVKLAGTTGGVIMSAKAFDSISFQFYSVNEAFDIPVLFIVDDAYNPFGLHQVVLEDDLSLVNEVVEYINTNNDSAILVIKKGSLT